MAEGQLFKGGFKGLDSGKNPSKITPQHSPDCDNWVPNNDKLGIHGIRKGSKTIELVDGYPITHMHRWNNRVGQRRFARFSNEITTDTVSTSSETETQLGTIRFVPTGLNGEIYTMSNGGTYVIGNGGSNDPNFQAAPVNANNTFSTISDINEYQTLKLYLNQGESPASAPSGTFLISCENLAGTVSINLFSFSFEDDGMGNMDIETLDTRYVANPWYNTTTTSLSLTTILVMGSEVGGDFWTASPFDIEVDFYGIS